MASPALVVMCRSLRMIAASAESVPALKAQLPALRASINATDDAFKCAWLRAWLLSAGNHRHSVFVARLLRAACVVVPVPAPAAFYKAAFKLSCESSQKTLAPGTAVALLEILFPDADAIPHLGAFITFLSTKPGLKRITMDEVPVMLLLALHGVEALFCLVRQS